MTKEIFEAPVMEIVKFENEDILTASGDDYVGEASNTALDEVN